MNIIPRLSAGNDRSSKSDGGSFWSEAATPRCAWLLLADASTSASALLSVDETCSFFTSRLKRSLSTRKDCISLCDVHTSLITKRQYLLGSVFQPSVLEHCWSGVWKPVKNLKRAIRNGFSSRDLTGSNLDVIRQPKVVVFTGVEISWFHMRSVILVNAALKHRKCAQLVSENLWLGCVRQWKNAFCSFVVSSAGSQRIKGVYTINENTTKYSRKWRQSIPKITTYSLYRELPACKISSKL